MSGSPGGGGGGRSVGSSSQNYGTDLADNIGNLVEKFSSIPSSPKEAAIQMADTEFEIGTEIGGDELAFPSSFNQGGFVQKRNK